MAQQRASGIGHLPAFDDESGDLNTVVEAVKGSRNKFKFDPRRSLFIHDSVLPAGATFPFDFGFVPSTEADDGDPLDVLILMDEPAFVGAVIPCRLVGAIEAEQTEKDGETMRNDRLIAVAANSQLYADVKSFADLPSAIVDAIEHFWISYNETKGKQFTPIARAGRRKAQSLVDAAIKSKG